MPKKVAATVCEESGGINSFGMPGDLRSSLLGAGVSQKW